MRLINLHFRKIRQTAHGDRGVISVAAALAIGLVLMAVFFAWRSAHSANSTPTKRTKSSHAISTPEPPASHLTGRIAA